MSSPFLHKKIILGVCGSIAAYKSVFLCRALIKEGAEVKVVMTHYAQSFVSALTFSTLSKNQVFSELVDVNEWNNHVELGLWADMMIIAPATASTISKMASGNVDNMLLAVYLSAKCPVYIAPAMDLDMWAHPSTKKNIQTLNSYGNTIIPVGHGELASGLHGDGRMAEPEFIQDFLASCFSQNGPLLGKTVLITAGPTYENIDPVRFIGNASSGKMGIALADVFCRAGAKVQLVLGPSSYLPKEKDVHVNQVTTSDEMFQVCEKIFKKTDIAIFAAAVADYKPATVKEQKIKKIENSMTLDLVRTIDIAASLGENKKKNQFTVGFALETNDEMENANRKLKSKNFDMIVLNSLREEGAGFQFDTNKITIVEKNGQVTPFSLKTKEEVAKDILDKVVENLTL
ncbi:MAG: bifunctional phosphopantothenoylcysteine decarboxylase/phosphopantothenate--cysteine ligase CoaBC [Saprospiraceae bacterium]